MLTDGFTQFIISVVLQAIGSKLSDADMFTINCLDNDISMMNEFLQPYHYELL